VGVCENPPSDVQGDVLIEKRLARESEILGNFFGAANCCDSDRKKLNFAMLKGYFDESGIHPGDHLTVVAGFVGNEKQWNDFSADWIKALAPRPHLHMVDLRWNQHPDEVRKLLARLGPIPERHGLLPVVGGLWQRDYEAVVKGRVRGMFTTPYILALIVCMVKILQFISPSEDISFMFENQGRYKNAAQEMHDAVFNLQTKDPRVKGLVFVPKGAIVCTEPADYLAYQVHQYHSDQTSEKSKMGMSILGDGDVVGHIFTRDALKIMVDTLVASGLV
jgi:hypothetical protein